MLFFLGGGMQIGALVKPVSTRWNSQRDCAKSVLDKQSSIVSFAASPKATDLYKDRVALLRDDGGFVVLQQFVDFISPLIDLTNLVSSEKIVTSSLVVPFLLTAKRKIDAIVAAARDQHIERIRHATQQARLVCARAIGFYFLKKCCFVRLAIGVTR